MALAIVRAKHHRLQLLEVLLACSNVTAAAPLAVGCAVFVELAIGSAAE